LKHAGIEYTPYTNLPPNVIDALRRGKKIEAIKHYRNATSVSLKEAKDVIEDVQRDRFQPRNTTIQRSEG
jgi:hypothetical protein